MLLAIDAGNTETKVGLFDGPQLIGVARLPTARTPEPVCRTVAALLAGAGAGPRELDGVAIATVVPSATGPLAEAARLVAGAAPLFLGADLDLRMPVRYEPPASLGADRLANAVAARALHGAPVIVVDCGTATKIEAVDARGVYLGGAIAPGIRSAADALFRRAALLDEVPLEAPARAIGGSTREALQSGIVLGAAASIEGLVARFRDELGVQAPVVGTGGLLEIVAPACPVISEREPALTLHGIRLAWEWNRGEAGCQG